MKFLNDLSIEIFGQFTLVFYISYFFYVFFGVIFSAAIVAYKTRDKKSERTPEKFSIIFLLKDNALRIFISLMLVFIFVRFGQELTDTQPTHIGALAIGFCFDLIINKIDLIKEKINQIFNSLFKGLSPNT